MITSAKTMSFISCVLFSTASKPESLNRAENFIQGQARPPLQATTPSKSQLLQKQALATPESQQKLQQRKQRPRPCWRRQGVLREKPEEKSLEKKSSPPVEVDPSEIVRHVIPTDKDIICPLCLDAVRDQGKAREAIEIDVADTQLIKRLHLLHQGSCPCGSLIFTMPSPIRGVEQTCLVRVFVAQIVYNKFVMHLPLYRQAKDLVQRHCSD